MKQKVLQNLLSVIILCVILFVSISYVSGILQNKESDLRYAAVYSDQCEVDVIFCGSSHIRYAIYPMELWNDYGITSYNIAADGNTIPVAYWNLVNVLDYQTPKLVVMDVFDMFPGKKVSITWGQVHQSVDAIPISINKIRMIKDLLNEEELEKVDYDEYDKRWELFFQLGEYHSRWNDLGEDDFLLDDELVKKSLVWKGAEPLTNLGFHEGTEESTEEPVFDQCAYEYMVKMIELCQSKDIEIMLVNTGYNCTKESQLFADAMDGLAEKYQISYVDFTKTKVISFDTDLSNGGSNTHLNFSGAEKLTNYIGNFINTNYDLPDHRNEEAYSQWNEDFDKFAGSKINYLSAQTDLNCYLLMLQDDDYDVKIVINDPSILREGYYGMSLLNLGVDINYIVEGIDVVSIMGESRQVSYETVESKDLILGEVYNPDARLVIYAQNRFFEDKYSIQEFN